MFNASNRCCVASATTPRTDASDWDGHDAGDRVSGAASAFAFGLGLGPASLPAAVGARLGGGPPRRPPPGFEHLAAGGAAFGTPAPPAVQWGWSDAAAHGSADAAAGSWPTTTSSSLASGPSSAAASPTFSRSTAAGRRPGLGLGAVVLEDGDDDDGDGTARRLASGDASGLGQPLAAYGGPWDAVAGRSAAVAPAVLALHKAGQDHLTPAEASHLARQLDASHTVSPFQSAFQRLEATATRPELPLTPTGRARGAPPGLGPVATAAAPPSPLPLPRRTTPVPSPNRSRVAVVPLEPEPDDADDELSYYEGDLGAIYPALLHAPAPWPSPLPGAAEAPALAAALADLGGTCCLRGGREGRKRRRNCSNSRTLAGTGIRAALFCAQTCFRQRRLSAR